MSAQFGDDLAIMLLGLAIVAGLFAAGGALCDWLERREGNK